MRLLALLVPGVLLSLSVVACSADASDSNDANDNTNHNESPLVAEGGD